MAYTGSVHGGDVHGPGMVLDRLDFAFLVYRILSMIGTDLYNLF